MPALSALFAVAIFTSAFLLFQVQPMVGKRILPWFGGVPGVWTLCLTFYQLTLFAGYGYAHLLVRTVPAARQPLVHGALFAGALLSLPVLPGELWKPDGPAEPSLPILWMLTTNVGLPFLFLSASGPLVQAWYARALPGRSPYLLYAVSNAGSLAALLSYPTLFEPNFALSQSARLWSWLFGGVGVAILVSAWRAGHPAPLPDDGPAIATKPASARDRPGTQPGAIRTALWILLPAFAVMLLMGVTNELCLDVASVPFLWIFPLALYLLTFILCFASDRLYARPLMIALAAISLGATAYSGELAIGMRDAPAGIAVLASVYGLLLFSHCYLLHGELYRLRPAPEELTGYYLCIAGGGALGGLFVGLAAPLVFTNYFELPIGIVGCWLLVLLSRSQAWAQGRARRMAWAGVLPALVAVLGGAVALGTADEYETVSVERNFFGVLRVIEDQVDHPYYHRYQLRSGTTTHGFQFRHPEQRQRATGYYGELSGIGIALSLQPASPVRVGFIGLGVGTLAVYGRSGDRYTFYEIDPGVIRAAEDERYFTNLKDSAAAVEVVLGDARLSLEARANSGEEPLQLLVLDAFNSDAVPIHLVTVEAFAVYDRNLHPDGVLAVHVSNLNLDLAPMVLGLGDALGMRGIEVYTESMPELAAYPSKWVLMSRDAEVLDRVESAAARFTRSAAANRHKIQVRRWQPTDDGPRLWTDDYSDVFGAL